MIGQFKDWVARKTASPIEFPVTVFDETLERPEDLEAKLKIIGLFTYRQGFECLPRSTETTDKGWGCLIRTGQMLLHECMRRHGAFKDEQTLREKFRDLPSETEAPFSIHNMVRGICNPNDKFTAGYWSPKQGSDAIKAVVANAHLEKPLLVLQAEGDGQLYNDEIMYSVEEAPTLILVPMRTSLSDRITHTAWATFKHLLSTNLCVGIVGGSPKRSYYFFGTAKGEKALYLDPHQETQKAYVSDATAGIVHETAQTVPQLEWKRIDSSMVVGFYVKDANEWQELSRHIFNIEKTGGDVLLRVADTRGAANTTARDDVESFGSEHSDG